jgi:sugar phosphate isomerase/epimerase
MIDTDNSRFRYAVCEELFENWELKDICICARSLGYTGIELTPGTLIGHILRMPNEDLQYIRSIIEDNGLQCTGLHWLLAHRTDLHLTTTDAAVRQQGWDYLRSLADVCAKLGGTYLTLGSPKQRSGPGINPKEAASILRDGLAELASYAEERGVVYLMEPINDPGCDVVDNMKEAVEIVRGVNHPGVATIYDFSHLANDPPPREALIQQYQAEFKHVHATTRTGTHCGDPKTVDAEFTPIWQELRKVDYKGWISIEVFDFSAGPENIAREGAEFFQRMEESLRGE